MNWQVWGGFLICFLSGYAVCMYRRPREPERTEREKGFDYAGDIIAQSSDPYRTARRLEEVQLRMTKIFDFDRGMIDACALVLPKEGA